MTAESAAANYINNLKIGQTLITNDLADVIRNADSRISDVGDPNRPITEIFIWRGRPDGTRYSRLLVSNYTPAQGERVVAETSQLTPVVITFA